MPLIDLSHPLLEETPCYPGDMPLKLTKIKSLEKDHFVSYHLSSTLHTGTHIDVPMHLVDDGRHVLHFPLEAFAGPGLLLDVRGKKTLDYQIEYESLVQPEQVVLLYSGFDRFFHDPRYFSSHPVISDALADFLIQKNIKMLGMDFPSPDYFPFKVHKKFLAHQIILLENAANLGALKNIPAFHVMAFPLKIKAEGSFVRAVARIV